VNTFVCLQAEVNIHIPGTGGGGVCVCVCGGGGMQMCKGEVGGRQTCTMCNLSWL
jgi:hypothetical protein